MFVSSIMTNILSWKVNPRVCVHERRRHAAEVTANTAKMGKRSNVCVCVKLWGCEVVRRMEWDTANTRKSFVHAKLLSFASTDKRSKMPSHSLECVRRNIEEKLSAWQRQHHRRRRPRPRRRWQWTRTHFEVKPKNTTQWTWLSAGLQRSVVTFGSNYDISFVHTTTNGQPKLCGVEFTNANTE